MRTLFSVLLFLCLSLTTSAQNHTDSLIQKISERLDAMPNGFVISIALLKNGTVDYIGLIKENDQLIVSNTEDSLFEIGSLTKVFTSTLLANEVIRKNVKLQDPVNKAFSFKFNDKVKLSYLSLANHTSGLYRLPSNIMPYLFKNPDNPYSEYTYDLFNEFLMEELQIANNETLTYDYSNLGAGLLAYALASKKNQKFESLLQETIFDKYTMSSTAFERKTSFDGIGADGSKAENWQFKALKGAGGLISNTSDLSKFIQAQFDIENTELALTRKETFSISNNFSIGLGWHIYDSNQEEEKYWHNGGTGGYTSSISFRTTNQTGVIILSNISALHEKSPVIDELCFELLELIK